MPRPLTLAAVESMLSQHSDKVWCWLLKISHPSIITQRFTTNSEALTRTGGEVFAASDFAGTLPEQNQTGGSPMQIVVDAVAPEITEALRSLPSPAKVMVDLVLADDPDTRQAGADLELQLAEGGERGQIVLHLAARAAGRRKYPVHEYRAPWFPAIP